MACLASDLRGAGPAALRRYTVPREPVGGSPRSGKRTDSDASRRDRRGHQADPSGLSPIRPLRSYPQPEDSGRSWVGCRRRKPAAGDNSRDSFVRLEPVGSPSRHRKLGRLSDHSVYLSDSMRFTSTPVVPFLLRRRTGPWHVPCAAQVWSAPARAPPRSGRFDCGSRAPAATDELDEDQNHE